MTDREDSALRQQVVQTLQRARRLPAGSARNDLRQLARNLRCLDRLGIEPGRGVVVFAFDDDVGLSYNPRMA